MRIQFTETVIYETEGPGKGPSYHAGQEVDLRDDLAERWLRRGVAVRVVAEVTSAPSPDPSSPEPPPAPARPQRTKQ